MSDFPDTHRLVGPIPDSGAPDVAEPRSEKVKVATSGFTGTDRRHLPDAPGPSVELDWLDFAIAKAMNADTPEEEAVAMGEIRSEITHLRAEVGHLRRKLFGIRQVEGHDHSTACSMWGEDGQGNVAGIPGPHPCNCGALLNYGQEAITRLRAENDRLGEALRKLAQLDCTLDAPMDNGARVVHAADIATEALRDTPTKEKA